MEAETSKALAVLRDSVGASVFKSSMNPADMVLDWRRDAGWNTLESMLGISVAGARTVTLAEALRQTAVMACVDVISQDIAKVPLEMWRNLPNGGREKVGPRDHWFAKMLALSPNQEQSWFDFWQMVVIHLLLANNCFIAANKNTRGVASELIPIMPGRVMIEVVRRTREILYGVNRGTVFEQAQLRDFANVLTQDECIHIKSRVVDGLHGFPTLYLASPTMQLSRAITDYQTRLYNNDGQMRLIFQQKADSPGVTPEAFERLKQDLRTATQTFHQKGIPIVLEAGLEAKDIAQSAAETEIAKVRDAQTSEATRAFRVPPHKVGHLVGVKYENMDTMERAYASDSLVPIAKAVEESLKRNIFDEDEQLDFTLEFNREAMTVKDLKVQAEVDKVSLQHGAMEVDEYRGRRGANPLPNGAGQVRLLQSTMQVIDRSNKVVIAAGKPKPGANPNPAEDDERDEEDRGEEEGDKPEPKADEKFRRAPILRAVR